MVFFNSRNHGFLFLLLDRKKTSSPNIGIGAIWSTNKSKSVSNLNCIDVWMATTKRKTEITRNVRKSFF